MENICNKCEHANYCEYAKDGKTAVIRICCPKFRTKTKTNADRIRSMTDEELAYFIACDYYVPHCPTDGECLGGDGGCEECWLEWLKQKAADKDGAE